MMIAVAVAASKQYDAMCPSKLSGVMLQIAGHVKPKTLRNHPLGPKPPKKKGYVCGTDARWHVSTARVPKERAVN
jgi:hypothetical protein